jgi:hypothetical protein
MTTDQYRSALDAAVREYEKLGEQRREIDERLAQLAQTIGTLNRLCGLVPTVFWGLTDACRVVLKGFGRPMAPLEVRDRLLAIGFDLSKYANSLAAIHTVLKRLAEAGEVRSVALDQGKVFYLWQQAAPRVLVMNEAELANIDLADIGPPHPATASKKKKRRKK